MLERENLDRELGGLFEALAFSGQNTGLVITLNQSDSFTSDNMTAQIMPAWKFLGETPDKQNFLF